MKTLIPTLICLLPTLLPAQNPLTFTTNNSLITITGYVGAPGGVTNVFIADTINGRPVVSINGNAFSGCTNLTNVVIGITGNPVPGAAVINTGAFSGCTNLMNVVISPLVGVIGSYAFRYCSSLKTITIPATANISPGAFGNCASLTNITVATDHPSYSSINGVVFNKNQTTLMMFPSGFGSYTIPNSVTSIGDYAFLLCTNRMRVLIPNGVTNIGTGAFYLSGLTNLTIPASVTSIGGTAFYGCPSLTNLTFLGNAPTLGANAFFSVPGTVYYYFGASDWSTTYGGLPTVMLGAPSPLQIGGSVGILAGKFGFTVTDAANQTVVVDASTNLTNWQPVWTNTLTSTSTNFTDAQWTNYPRRFYRAR